MLVSESETLLQILLDNRVLLPVTVCRLVSACACIALYKRQVLACNHVPVRKCMYMLTRDSGCEHTGMQGMDAGL